MAKMDKLTGYALRILLSALYVWPFYNDSLIFSKHALQ